MAIFLLIIW